MEFEYVFPELLDETDPTFLETYHQRPWKHCRPRYCAPKCLPPCPPPRPQYPIPCRPLYPLPQCPPCYPPYPRRYPPQWCYPRPLPCVPQRPWYPCKVPCPPGWVPQYPCPYDFLELY